MEPWMILSRPRPVSPTEAARNEIPPAPWRESRTATCPPATHAGVPAAAGRAGRHVPGVGTLGERRHSRPQWRTRWLRVNSVAARERPGPVQPEGAGAVPGLSPAVPARQRGAGRARAGEAALPAGGPADAEREAAVSAGRGGAHHERRRGGGAGPTKSCSRRSTEGCRRPPERPRPPFRLVCHWKLTCLVCCPQV